MEEKKLINETNFGQICIAVAIVIAAIIIYAAAANIKAGFMEVGSGIHAQAQSQREAANISAVNQYPAIMDENQAASYLNIPVDKLLYLADETSGMGLPVLKIDGNLRFSRTALDEWMKTPHGFSN